MTYESVMRMTLKPENMMGSFFFECKTNRQRETKRGNVLKSYPVCLPVDF